MIWKPKQSKFSAIFKRAWSIPRILRTASIFSFVSCLVFASSSAKALTQQEVEDAVYNALVSAPISFNNGAINTVPWLYPSFDGLTIGEWLLYASGYNPTLEPLSTNFRSDLLSLLLAVRMGDTNLVNFLRPVLAPENQANLYEIVDNGFRDSQSILWTIDEDVRNLSIQDYSSTLYDILDSIQGTAGQVNLIEQLLNSVSTVSGADNMNNPAIEANDSYTHALLLDLYNKLQDIDSNQQGAGGDIGALYQEAQAINMRLMDMAREQVDFAEDWRHALEKVMRDNWRDVNPDKEGIQVFDALTHMSITNLLRTERQFPGEPPQSVNIMKDGLQVFDPYVKLGYQYNTNFWYGFVRNLVVGSGTNRAIRVIPTGSFASNLQEIASFYTPEDRIALDTNSVVVSSVTNTNLVDNTSEEKALEETASESVEDFEKDVEEKQEDAQDAVDELVSTVDESFDEIKDKLDPGQHEERLIDGLAPSTSGGSSKLLIWNAWEHSGIHVPKLEIDFGDKRLENFRKRANLILRSCYWLAFCLTAINLLRSLAIYLFSLGHVNEVAANALDAVGASGWQSSTDPWETAHYADWMNGGAMRELEESRNHK